MKKIYMFSFAAMGILNAMAQDAPIKNNIVSDETVGLTYKLYGKSLLTKTNTYKEIYPTTLNNTAPASIKAVIDPALSMEAKAVKESEAADYTFKYVTKGLEVFNDEGNYMDKYVNAKGIYVDVAYKKLGYSVDFNIEILDKTGTLIKTIKLADKNRVFHYTINKTFLVPPATQGKPPVVQLGFDNYLEADSFVIKNKAQLMSIFESNILYQLKIEIRRSIYSLYDFSKFGKTNCYYYELEKKAKKEYPDLYERNDLFKKAMNDFEDEPKRATAITSFNDFYTFYIGKMNDATLPDDVQQMCKYNAALSALYINKAKESKAIFEKFFSRYVASKSGGIFSTTSQLEPSYKDIYQYFNIYNEIQNNINNPIVDLNSGLEDIIYKQFSKGHDAANLIKKQNEDADAAKAAADALRNPNIVGKTGIVYDKGEKLEGWITYYFEPAPKKESGIVDLDGQMLTYVPKQGKVKEFKPKNIDSFEVDNIKYHAFEVKSMSGGFNAIYKVASGGASGVSFYKLVSQNNIVGLYNEARTAGDRYVIKLQSDKKGFYASDLLEAKKFTKDFNENCTNKANINMANYTNTLDSLLKLIADIEAACKK